MNLYARRIARMFDPSVSVYERLSFDSRLLYNSQYSVCLVRQLSATGIVILRDAWPPELRSSAFAVLEALFEQPEEWKLEHRAIEPRLDGFVEYGRTRAADTGVANLLEAWCVSRAFERVPQDIPGGRSLMDAATELRSIGMRVIDALDHGLGAMGRIASLVNDDSHGLYGLFYPKRLLGQRSNAVRQSLHADSSICSLLPMPTSPGLLVALGDNLIPLHPLPGDIILVAGRVLEYLTMRQIIACQHTVATPSDAAHGSDRISLVYFIEAPDNVVIAPLPAVGTRAAEFQPLMVRELLQTSHGKVYDPGTSVSIDRSSRRDGAEGEPA